jgi:alpha-glutamyl/putrescinyl thymine pyrophosphorylase clade 1
VTRGRFRKAGSNGASQGACASADRREPREPSHLSPLRVTDVYKSYWRFAAERQQVFLRRLTNTPRPWTTDPIIAEYKFTNSYRASDRVSQFLIRRVIYRDDLPTSGSEVLFRTLLFKLFNKIETWELLEHSFGAITFADYRFEHYDRVLTQAKRAGGRIYSAAYIMPPGGSSFGYPAKHQNHLRLLESMMADGLARRLAKARRMQQAFELLRSYPTIGDFLAYQFVTDINYSELTDFSEMEFVVPGPGARDGIQKCFIDSGGLNEPELIRLMVDNQEREFERYEVEFPSLWGRRLQLIDCQNLFCEVSKYARVAHPNIAGHSGRTRIKQKFSPTASHFRLWYPPKWGINDLIRAGSPGIIFGKPDHGFDDRLRHEKQATLELGSTEWT